MKKRKNKMKGRGNLSWTFLEPIGAEQILKPILKGPQKRLSNLDYFYCKFNNFFDSNQIDFSNKKGV